MANRIEPFEVTIPANTAIASFQRTDLSMQDGRADKVQIRVPPGPSGLVGFKIAHSGQSVIPYFVDRWFITDNDKLDWDLANYPQGDAWQLWAYNLDVYAHTLYLWFHVTDLDVMGVPIIQPVVIAQTASSEVEPASGEEQ